MITPTLEAQILLLDDRINILESNAAEYSPAKHAFEAVGDILALARVSILLLSPPVSFRISSMT